MAIGIICAIVVNWLSLAVMLVISVMYFRDLGDVTQMILKVKRENMTRLIRNEKQFVMAGLAAAAVMVVGYLMGGGTAWLFWISLAVLMLAAPYRITACRQTGNGAARWFPVGNAKSSDLRYYLPLR